MGPSVYTVLSSHCPRGPGMARASGRERWLETLAKLGIRLRPVEEGGTPTSPRGDRDPGISGVLLICDHRGPCPGSGIPAAGGIRQGGDPSLMAGLGPVLKTRPQIPVARPGDLSLSGGPAGFLDRVRAFSSWQRQAQRYWSPWPIRPFLATRAWTLMAHAPEEFPALVRLLDRIEGEGPDGYGAWELRHRFFRALARPVGPRGLNAVRSADWGWVLDMGPDVGEGLEAEVQAFMAARWAPQAVSAAPGATVIDRARHLVGEWLESPSAVRSSR